jgi:hypothetical protein
LGRARYERRPQDQRQEPGEEGGLRNGFRPRRVQTAEDELGIEIPQVRQAAETFASKMFPRTPKLLRTDRRVAPGCGRQRHRLRRRLERTHRMLTSCQAALRYANDRASDLFFEALDAETEAAACIRLGRLACRVAPVGLRRRPARRRSRSPAVAAFVGGAGDQRAERIVTALGSIDERVR